MAWSKPRRAFLVSAGLGLLASCASHRPLPLDANAVNAALEPPKLETVKILASRIEHPLLQPLTIDGRDGFSPDEIAVMTVVVSPELRALRDQRGVARAQVLQAGILPNPQLSYSLDRPHGNSDPTLVDAPTLALSWEFTALLARHDDIAAAKASSGAVDLSVAWQEWQTAQDARLRAFRLLALERESPLAAEIETDAADSLVLTKRALTLGHKTAADLTAATTAWTLAQNNRLALAQQIRAERRALNLALALPADQTVILKDASAFPDLPTNDSATAATLLQGLEKRRLDLVALTLGYESQEAGLRAAVKRQFPKIGLSLSRAKDTSAVKSRGFGVTIDLPLFDRNQGQIAIARATRQQLFDEYVARVAEARAEVRQILDELAETRAQLRAVDESLPEFEQLVSAFEQALATRNADIPAYREARAALATRRMDRFQLQQSVLELGVALEIATGRPLLNRAAVN